MHVRCYSYINCRLCMYPYSKSMYEITSVKINLESISDIDMLDRVQGAETRYQGQCDGQIKGYRGFLTWTTKNNKVNQVRTKVPEYDPNKDNVRYLVRLQRILIKDMNVYI